jgi:hypothetical protein
MADTIVPEWSGDRMGSAMTAATRESRLPLDPRPDQRWLRWVGLISLPLLLVGLPLTFLTGITQVEFAENVSGVPWLPAAARNVSYYRSYSWTAYEFDIPEADFLTWASDYDLQPIHEKVVVSRYLARMLNWSVMRNPSSTREAEVMMARQEHYRGLVSHSIEHGHYHRTVQSNGGGITVAYDSDIGRAFVQRSPR